MDCNPDGDLKSELLDAFFCVGICKHVPGEPRIDRMLEKQFRSLSTLEADFSATTLDSFSFS